MSSTLPSGAGVAAGTASLQGQAASVAPADELRRDYSRRHGHGHGHSRKRKRKHKRRHYSPGADSRESGSGVSASRQWGEGRHAASGDACDRTRRVAPDPAAHAHAARFLALVRAELADDRRTFRKFMKWMRRFGKAPYVLALSA